MPHNELIAVLGLPFDSGSFDDSEEVRPPSVYSIVCTYYSSALIGINMVIALGEYTCRIMS